MMRNVIAAVVMIAGLATGLTAQPSVAAGTAAQDTVANLLQTLVEKAAASDVALFQRHCNSIITLIGQKDSLTPSERRFLGDMYLTFADTTLASNSGEMATYLERDRPLIAAWKSPTDSVISALRHSPRTL